MKETEMNVTELSYEELQNISGGAWWEVRYEKGSIVFVFHAYDDDH